VGLWQDPVCAFLLSERDLAVHHDGTVSVVEGRAAYLWVMPARAYASGGRAIFTTSPANPTSAQKVRLRRQMKLAKKAAAVADKNDRKKLARNMHEDRMRDEAEVRARMAKAPPERHARFDHENPRIGQRPATEVVEEYIRKLEAILAQLVSYEPTN